MRVGFLRPIVLLLSSAALWMALSGCVTEIEKPAAQTNLFVTRAGNQTQLSWQSRAGESYSIWYAATRGAGAQWKVLPGCERIAGTGDVIQRADAAASMGEQRFYRLMIEPAK